ncbi:MAG: glycosyltransferase family 4 protein [Synechococcaceae cyanobacterium SM2_3_1]|nr:glycosyltransferase family 4 protein [Synechococcaceae cyanobacterium SM2_3_1]
MEAQACGCPVVCSNEGPLPEVAGEAALMAPALDEDQLADDLYSLVINPELRSDQIKKGLENVKRFLPEKMIQQYVDLYEKIAASSSP